MQQTPILSALHPTQASAWPTRTLICLWMMSLVMLAFAIFWQWGRWGEAIGRAAVHPSMPPKQRSTPRAFNYLQDTTGREQRQADKYIRPFIYNIKYLIFKKQRWLRTEKFCIKASARNLRVGRNNARLKNIWRKRPSPVCGEIHDEQNSRPTSASKSPIFMPAKTPQGQGSTLFHSWPPTITRPLMPNFTSPKLSNQWDLLYCE